MSDCDQKPETIDPIKLAAIMAKENASMHECSLAAQCIRDLYDQRNDLLDLAHAVVEEAMYLPHTLGKLRSQAEAAIAKATQTKAEA